MTVAAVVTGAPGAVDACRAALAAQTVAVELDVPDPASCELVWFLHGAARPEPDALERLLAAPAAPVRAGLVVDGEGVPCPHAAPQVAEREPLLMVQTVRDGRLPIRYATLAHTLVAASAVRADGGPAFERFGPYADAQWTARVLAGGHGWWVTRSVAVAARCPAAPTASLGAKLRMLRSGAWTATEAIERLMPIDRADEPHPSRGR